MDAPQSVTHSARHRFGNPRGSLGMGGAGTGMDGLRGTCRKPTPKGLGSAGFLIVIN